MFDLSFCAMFPALPLAPSTGQELADMLAWAWEQRARCNPLSQGPYSAVSSGIYSANYDPTRSVELRTGRDCVIFAVGPLVYEALAAAEMLYPQIDCSVVDVRSIKPLDSATILRLSTADRECGNGGR